MNRGQLESAVRREYESLVRLAYLVIAPKYGRHRRVLMAHTLVQGIASGRRRPDNAQGLYSAVIAAASARPGWRYGAHVRRLRIFPASDAIGSLGLELQVDELARPARAAWAVHHVFGVDANECAAILRAAGVRDVDRALDEAAAIPGEPDQLFDPCEVRLAPVALKPRYAWRVGAVLAVLMVLSLVAAALGNGSGEPAASPGAQQPAGAITHAEKAPFTTVSASRWRTTTRVDFGAWPARGSRVKDQQLLARALQAWTSGRGITATAGTPADPPRQRPVLLYAGRIDRASVVLFFDGLRLARYTEPLAGAAPTVALARADDADVTTGAAVAISESRSGRRFLLAPWIVKVQLRDLMMPSAAARPLRWRQGVTAPVRGADDCGSQPVLQLRSSSEIAEKHAFLIADLGDLIPVHLTFMPLSHDQPARQPREAVGTPGLVSWARTSCTLFHRRHAGLRSANNWTFAEQNLPDAGPASWVCTRFDGWAGQGAAAVNLVPRAGRTVPAGSVGGTADCSRFGQDVLAATSWRSPSGTRYVVAAGSRRVSGLTVDGKEQTGQTALVASDAPNPPAVTARLADGTTLHPLDQRN